MKESQELIKVFTTKLEEIKAEIAQCESKLIIARANFERVSGAINGLQVLEQKIEADAKAEAEAKSKVELVATQVPE